MKRLLALSLIVVLGISAQKRETKKESQLRKELATAYSRWLTEDVTYIVSEEEKRAFRRLRTDDERERFVEQFWLRRDPTPDTIENEYKEEHYRRIAYANEHFASGVSGWRTDRGRIYIRFGAPDEIEAHPAAEGGGETSTYPFETWRYRHLDKIGENIRVEFVDSTRSGEYLLTANPCENDARLYVPLAEQRGLSAKTTRVQNADAATCSVPLGIRPESYDELNRSSLAANLEKPPAIKFRDLENTLVTTSLKSGALPMQVRVDYLRVTNFSVMACVTVEFQNRDLQYSAKDGMQEATIELLGHVYTPTRRPAATFEKALEIAAPDGMPEQTLKDRSVWQAALPLAPGRYQLVIAARDRLSGAVGRYEAALDVPRFEETELATSSLILADTIAKLPTSRVGGALFAIGDTKVRPRVGARFSPDEKLGIYFQLYNAANPKVRIAWEVSERATGRKALDFTEDIPGVNTIQKLLPLKDFAPGDYTLKVRIDDGVSRIVREAPFSISR